MTIQVQFDFSGYARRNRAGARHAVNTRQWMATQTTNVLAEARDRATPQARLDEIAVHGNAACREAVAGNPSASPAALHWLSEPDLITSKIAQRLSRNPAAPVGALRNVQRSVFWNWFGNHDRIVRHPNWPGSN